MPSGQPGVGGPGASRHSLSRIVGLDRRNYFTATKSFPQAHLPAD